MEPGRGLAEGGRVCNLLSPQRPLAHARTRPRLSGGAWAPQGTSLNPSGRMGTTGRRRAFGARLRCFDVSGGFVGFCGVLVGCRGFMVLVGCRSQAVPRGRLTAHTTMAQPIAAARWALQVRGRALCACGAGQQARTWPSISQLLAQRRPVAMPRARAYGACARHQSVARVTCRVLCAGRSRDPSAARGALHARHCVLRHRVRREGARPGPARTWRSGPVASSLALKPGPGRRTRRAQVSMSKFEPEEYLNDRYKAIEDRLSVSSGPGSFASHAGGSRARPSP